MLKNTLENILYVLEKQSYALREVVEKNKKVDNSYIFSLNYLPHTKIISEIIIKLFTTLEHKNNKGELDAELKAILNELEQKFEVSYRKI